MRNNKGFTLVELIIVIAILAIIMLIAIPNFSGIQQRMQVRADKSTAAQIGKAVRVWFTDYTTDGGLVKEAGTKYTNKYLPVKVMSGATVVNPGIPTTGTVETTHPKYDELAGISEYISEGKTPDSLKDPAKDNTTVDDQAYYVALTEDATNSSAKIVVYISGSMGAEGSEQFKAPTFSDPVTVNYDGKDAGIAYVEP